MTPGLRVGLDITPLLGPPSGIHQVTRGLLRGLASRDDVEVSGWLLTARGGRPDVAIPVRRSRVPARLALWGWSRGGFPPGRLITGAVDVVHGTNFVAPPSPRSLISVQDLTPVTHPEWVRPEVAAMAGPLRNAVRRGAWIHTSSQAVADEAIEVLGVDPERVVVVHHAVGPIEGGDRRRAARLTGGAPYVLMLGTVEARKNVPSVVPMLDRLSTDVHLAIAGPPGNHEDHLAAAIGRSGQGHRIHRFAEVTDELRADLLAGASVLAFPSLHEGFGLPPLEAIVAGVPVVATAVGALPELIGDLVDLVEPADDAAFGSALGLRLSDRATSPAARDRLLGYTWDDAAAQIVDVYRHVAGQAGGEPASR